MVVLNNFENRLEKKVIEIENIIKSFLPKEEGHQKIVIEAMNYSMNAGGKRIRPMLMQLTYELFGGTGEVIKPFMAAMEMIHTYSLIHDDLPSMDNDEYRRGRKTTHIVYGEAMAILAGDGLLNFAFETACKGFQMDGNLESVAKAITLLSKKSGIYGMIGGQTLDICAEERKILLDEEQVLFIHKNKTAALIEGSMMIGAILAGATEEQVEIAEKIAYSVGIAFQIRDDILDVTSSLEVLGKLTGSDDKNNKMTYVTLKGLEESKNDVERLSKKAMGYLKKLQNSNDFLEELIFWLICREK